MYRNILVFKPISNDRSDIITKCHRRWNILATLAVRLTYKQHYKSVIYYTCYQHCQKETVTLKKEQRGMHDIVLSLPISNMPSWNIEFDGIGIRDKY